MAFEIKVVPSFKKEIKKLAKKYPSLKNDLSHLREQLMANPKIGTEIKENIYKIRMAITSKAKGKSGGARVIYTVLLKESVYLLAIYDKSNMGNITDFIIKKRIEELEAYFKK